MNIGMTPELMLPLGYFRTCWSNSIQQDAASVI